MKRFALLVALALPAGIAPVASPADACTISNPFCNPPYVDGPAEIIIGADQQLFGGTHTITKPVVVMPGVTWSIFQATVYFDWQPTVCTRGTAGYCHPNVLVMPGGKLVIRDSTIDAHDWTVDDPDSGYVIHALGSTLELKNSTFQHYTSIGAQQPAGTPSKVVGNTFRWAVTGVSFIRGAEAQIVGNTFEDVMFGTTVTDSSGEIRDNHFIRNHRNFSGKPSGIGINVQSTLVGDKVYVTQPVVSGNVVEDGHLGMLNLNGFPNQVRDNVFRGNTIGASIGLLAGEQTLNHQASVWTDNLFEDNVDAVVVYVSGSPRTVPEAQFLAFNGNSLVGTTCHDITALPAPPGVTLTVDANDNWWGTPDGPQDRAGDCTALAGDNIVVDRWLTESP